MIIFAIALMALSDIIQILENAVDEAGLDMLIDCAKRLKFGTCPVGVLSPVSLNAFGMLHQLLHSDYNNVPDYALIELYRNGALKSMLDPKAYPDVKLPALSCHEVLKRDTHDSANSQLDPETGITYGSISPDLPKRSGRKINIWYVLGILVLLSSASGILSGINLWNRYKLIIEQVDSDLNLHCQETDNTSKSRVVIVKGITYKVSPESVAKGIKIDDESQVTGSADPNESNGSDDYCALQRRHKHSLQSEKLEKVWSIAGPSIFGILAALSLAVLGNCK
eukprot:NODE_351_length_10383_cov_0.336153.p4 type:complete len:281 gc:universal NODE_351_length_10383_cov_0.336153:4438-5280(+)